MLDSQLTPNASVNYYLENLEILSSLYSHHAERAEEHVVQCSKSGASSGGQRRLPRWQILMSLETLAMQGGEGSLMVARGSCYE